MDKSPHVQQLPLDLPRQDAHHRDDLVVTAANANAVAYLDSWPDWNSPVTILAGPVGVGKTHLASIWADRANARFLEPGTIAAHSELAEHGNIVVEDIAHGNFADDWLFHIINGIKASGSSLLLTSRDWPGEWGVRLPDLESRLGTASLVELSEPDDALLAGVLTKLFSDRQLIVEPQVIDYLVTRMERSLASGQELVGQVDALSLASKRGVTKPLAAEALRLQGSIDD